MTGKKIEFIDFAKGYSIITIVLYHFLSRFSLPAILSKAIMFGGTGAHFFIFLSGFGLALSGKQDVLLFYKRRFVKIFIPYFIVISFIYIFNRYVPLYKDGLYAYCGHIFLFKMFDNSIVGSFGGHLWFVSVIFQFYIIYPFLVRLMHKIGREKFVIMSLAISVLYWCVTYVSGFYTLRIWNSFFLQFLREFSFAMVLAELYVQNKYIFWKQRNFFLLLVAISGIGLYGLLAIKGGKAGRIFNDIPALVGYASFCVLLYALMDKTVHFLKSMIIYVGGFSYSLYLTHVFVLDFFTRFFNTGKNFWGYHFFILIAAILVAIFFSRLSGLINNLIPKNTAVG